MKRIIVTENIFENAADRFVELARIAVEARNRLTVALAGGSTPKDLYRLLASEKYRSKIDWSKVFFFFGDERNVPPDDPQSNFRMADEHLFKPLGVTEKQVFRWPTEFSEPDLIARSYTQTLSEFFNFEKPAFPCFDLILLGLGEDGHTASLFPDTSALNEISAAAVENFVEKLDAWRFTLTFPIINNARAIIFLVNGEKKAEIVKSIIEGEKNFAKFPAQAVEAENLFFLLDHLAAKRLDKKFITDED